MVETNFFNSADGVAIGEDRMASQTPPPPTPILVPPQPIENTAVTIPRLAGEEPENVVRDPTVTNSGPIIDSLTGVVHRFWDEQTQGHFFTADRSEFNARQNNQARYRYEGVEFVAPSSLDSRAFPVYRFINELTGNYFYTLQEPDAITGQFPALESDGVAFHAYSPNGAAPPGAVPIYRFFNESASDRAGSPVHFFTGSEENKDNVRANEPGFTFEGIGWYALSPAAIPTFPEIPELGGSVPPGAPEGGNGQTLLTRPTGPGIPTPPSSPPPGAPEGGNGQTLVSTPTGPGIPEPGSSPPPGTRLGPNGEILTTIPTRPGIPTPPSNPPGGARSPIDISEQPIDARPVAIPGISDTPPIGARSPDVNQDFTSDQILDFVPGPPDLLF